MSQVKPEKLFLAYLKTKNILLMTILFTFLLKQTERIGIKNKFREVQQDESPFLC